MSKKILPKNLTGLFFTLLLCWFTLSNLQAQTVINHNMGAGSLVIQGNSTNNYYVTGTTSTYKIIVGAGYNGTITLSNVSITSGSVSSFTAACGNGTNTVTTGSCMAVMGKNRPNASAPAPNFSPVTKVNLVLEGNNVFQFTDVDYCALQVDEGAQIHISAIDPTDNNSGKLAAKTQIYPPGSQNIVQAGAGIGAIRSVGYNGTQGQAQITGGCGSSTYVTAGGNVIISSGTVTAWGAHGAGIGGGHLTYYNGIIIIYGGVVESYAGTHAAGIGSGCPLAAGLNSCYPDISAIIVLPPAQISVFGTDYPVVLDPALGLAGTKNITYINDPNKTLITVHTVDNTPNANIYLDLTQTPNLVNIFNTLNINYDLTKVKVGRTDATTGMFSFHAELQQNTTFFTDASSISPATYGRPYMPVITTITGNFPHTETVILPLLNMDVSITDYPSTPLTVGYTPTQAQQNAYRIKVSYNDINAFTNVTYTLQNEIDFSSLIFLASDSSTVLLSPPTTLTAGTVFYIVIPINQSRSMGIYSDVLQIDGNWNSVALPGAIRKVVQQRVVYDDTQTNIYICVSAPLSGFLKFYPAASDTSTVNLTLRINHFGVFPYDPLDVVAKYLITTEADYDAAVAATPLSAWPSLNIPAGEGTGPPTIASFNGKLPGIYYIHWYVVSGVFYSHSRTVVFPVEQCGGYGPYMIYAPVSVGSINTADTVGCSGQPVALTSVTPATGGSGNYIYTWQISSSSSGTWTDLPASNSENYITGALTAGTYYIRRMINDYIIILGQSYLIGMGYSNVITVTMNPIVIPTITINAIIN